MKALRTNVVYSQKIVIATAALFNFGRMLNDEPPDDGVDDEDFSADENDRTTRYRGQTERDRLRMNMRKIDIFFCCRPLFKSLNKKYSIVSIHY